MSRRESAKRWIRFISFGVILSGMTAAPVSVSHAGAIGALTSNALNYYASGLQAFEKPLSAYLSDVETLVAADSALDPLAIIRDVDGNIVMLIEPSYGLGALSVNISMSPQTNGFGPFDSGSTITFTPITDTGNPIGLPGGGAQNISAWSCVTTGVNPGFEFGSGDPAVVEAAYTYAGGLWIGCRNV